MWDIKELIQSRQRIQKQRYKERISDTYELASLVGLHVQALFDKDVKIPNKWDVYPELFEVEKKHYESIVRQEELETAKISRAEYARIHNERRRGKGIS